MKCQTCQEINPNCLECDVEGKCIKCDDSADPDKNGKCTICKNNYLLKNLTIQTCDCGGVINTATKQCVKCE